MASVAALSLDKNSTEKELKSNSAATTAGAAVKKAEVERPKSLVPAPVVEPVSRDRFIEASADIMVHLTDKLIALTRKPEFRERVQVILDPVVNHVINSVFPYIILSSILFLILLLVTVSTFIIVVRGSLLAIQSVDMAMKTGVPEHWDVVMGAAQG
jgi:hypothetical protein